MTEPVINALTGDAPQLGQDDATFDNNTNRFVGALGSFQTQINAAVTWISEKITEIAGSVSAASDSAAAAAASETAATGAANYQGDYDAGTLYAVGESVSYTGNVFVKKTTAPAGTAPVDGTDWLEIMTGVLTAAGTSGASQEVSFATSGIHNSIADAAVVTYSFAGAAPVAKVDLVIDYQAATAFDITVASLMAGGLNVGGQAASPQSMRFTPDGLTLFVLGAGSDDAVFEYTLTTAFDITTASYSGNSFSVAGQETDPRGMFFTPDGLSLFIVGSINDAVFEYTLTTAFDITTASYSGNSFSVAAEDGAAEEVEFTPDGLTLFVLGAINDAVFEYTLTTAFDITTASYSGNSFAPAEDSSPRTATFTPDGLTLFVLGAANDAVFEYTLTTAFDITTASYSGNSFSVAAEDGSPVNIVFGNDGLTLFYFGGTNTTVRQYDTSSLPTLVFPTMEKPTIPLALGEKTALSIVTSDAGASYQVVSAQGGIV